MTGRDTVSGQPGPGRRTLLRGGLLGGAGVAALAAGMAVSGRAGAQAGADLEPAPPGTAALGPAGDLVEPFHGPHQSGILTHPQPHGVFVALDLEDGAGAEEVGRLMRVWTDDISRLMAGVAPLTDQEPELAERASGLTVTVGWGASLFDRTGLQDVRPRWLRPLPELPIDQLDEAWGEADLVLQICAHSPVTVSHARRHLVGAAAGIARPRWLQTGFREPMERHGWSMRNLFGQVDGTVQPDAAGVDAPLVLIDPATGGSAAADPRWEGGSSLVLRRIRMDMADWDRADRIAREHSIGRDLATGAPLTGGTVDTPVDLHAMLPGGGLPVIDRDAHVRRASPHAPHERFLRRPYNYEVQRQDGSVETGLLFAAYQADPVRQFLPVQQRLAEADLLNLWTIPVGSAVFAILPGCAEGEWLGQHLLA